MAPLRPCGVRKEYIGLSASPAVGLPRTAAATCDGATTVPLVGVQRTVRMHGVCIECQTRIWCLFYQVIARRHAGPRVLFQGATNGSCLALCRHVISSREL